MLVSRTADRDARADHQCYAQWVRSAIGIARARNGDTVSLFESSIPEPRERLRQVAADAVTPTLSRYYASAFGDGNPFVRQMLAERYGMTTDAVVCTTGATGALSLIYRTFLEPGDHVLVETPGFDLFAGLAAAQHVHVDTFRRSGGRFTIDVAEVEARLRPRTRLVVLSNLHNPSGMLVAETVLRDLAALAVRRGFRLVIDEVYREYATGGGLRAPAAALSPAVISVSSLTKIYGLGALRCGWIIAAPDAILPIRDMNARVEFGMSTLSHTVAAHVLAAPGAFDAHSRDYVRSSRPVFEAWFSRMVEDGLMAGLLPDDGCICFPSLPGIADTKSFSEWLIARSGVIVAPGEYFGAPGHVRIGFCQPQDKLESGLAMLEDALRRYRADAVRPQ